ncbi:uncharacterized protein C8Q71DRAFT_764858 [Rhodofomes roseus]|uniref:Uncharacterized protein n=1 Tax=Rhodofomes roseus TaxID=34475 RepID=A0ABQ8KD15_9APHY|nr:uncharacterized protein C8Q71DRAFT_764858 [Rhodofomes roseus]KAH9835252.1 hypothetical protein C8Q71DRAFT_764858 [Rhodofomes roseus]
MSYLMGTVLSAMADVLPSATLPSHGQADYGPSQYVPLLPLSRHTSTLCSTIHLGFSRALYPRYATRRRTYSSQLVNLCNHRPSTHLTTSRLCLVGASNGNLTEPLYLGIPPPPLPTLAVIIQTMILIYLTNYPLRSSGLSLWPDLHGPRDGTSRSAWLNHAFITAEAEARGAAFETLVGLCMRIVGRRQDSGHLFWTYSAWTIGDRCSHVALI